MITSWYNIWLNETTLGTPGIPSLSSFLQIPMQPAHLTLSLPGHQNIIFTDKFTKNSHMAILCFMETTMVCLNMKTDVLHIHSVHYRHKVLVMMNGFALEESIFFLLALNGILQRSKDLNMWVRGWRGWERGRRKAFLYICHRIISL